VNNPLHTLWRGQDLLVLRQQDEIDCLHGPSIRRVVLVHRGSGDSPSDLAFAVFELDTDMVLLPAESGVGGRIHFERQAFWAQRNCIWWVPQAKVSLPRQLRPGHWLLRHDRPGHARVPREQLEPLLAQWPLEGPLTWEQRKWLRIARNRALAPLLHLDELRARRR
jgi:hypothetical protein